jgi:hypothetical protein
VKTAITRLLPLLSLAGCAWILGRESRHGTFTAQVTGDVAATLGGRAGSERLPASTGQGYSISLAAPDGRAIYLYSRARPSAGTFAIHPFSVEQPPDGYKAAFFSRPDGGAYLSDGQGTLQLTGGSALTGTFRFQGVKSPGGPPAVVEGTFTLR